MNNLLVSLPRSFRAVDHRLKLAILATVFLVHNVILFPAFALANDWYVRPTTSVSENGDGLSYETAWAGLNKVVWGLGGVEAGDTLYVCGLHDTSYTETRLDVQVSGAPSAAITISGACPGDPGEIWRVNFRLTSGWVGPDAFGAYSHSEVWGNTSNDLYEDGDLLTNPKSSLPDSNWTDGSFYHDSDTGILYYRPSDASQGGLPDDHVVYTGGGDRAISIVDQSYIRIVDIKLSHASMPRGVIHLSNADHITIDNIEVQFGYFCIGVFEDSDDVTIRNSRIHDCGSGLYLVSSTEATQHDNWLIQDNVFYNIGKNKQIAGNHWDLHAIGIQGGSNNVIEGNEGYNISGSGITLYFGGDQLMENNIIRYNFFRDIASNLHRTDTGDRQGSERGIEFGATNVRYIADRNKNNHIYGNIVVRARKAGIRIKAKTPSEGYTWNVHDNVIAESGNSFEFNGHVGPSGQDTGFIFQNNISYNPIEVERDHEWEAPTGRHISHIVGGGSSYNGVLMSNNLYYPDGPNETNARFEWHDIEYDSFESWRAAASVDANVGEGSVVGDPLLVNPSGATAEDFSVRANSPAIDAGADTGYDFDYNGYPSTNIVDIGAFESGCNFDAPKVSLSPEEVVTVSAGVVEYLVALTNNSCDEAAFDLSVQFEGLQGNLWPQHLDIRPGDTSYASVSVETADAAEGTYNILVTVEGAVGFWENTAQSRLQIDNTPPIAPASLAASVFDESGNQRLRLRWDAGRDIEPGSGIQSYRVYRDGVWFADAPGLEYVDDDVMSHIYEVAAVDRAGLESPDTAFTTFEQQGQADAEPPMVTITEPIDGAVVPSGMTTTINVVVNDNAEVDRIELYINDKLELTALRGDSLRYDLNVSNGNKKRYRIVAQAYDAAGNRGIHEVTISTSSSSKRR